MPSSCRDMEYCTGARQYQSRPFVADFDKSPMLTLVAQTDLYDKVRNFMQRVSTNWSLNLPTIHDLPFVTRLNTFDALARNALAMNIRREYLETDCHTSIFNQRGPELPGRQLDFPPDLVPTQLQKAVTHHSWLDLFPIPKLRDNILRGIEAGAFDEDELCSALCCDLLAFDTTATASLIVWGESWDAAGWEFSPEFFVKWGVLLRGCPEVLETTNFWRHNRGASRIKYQLS